MFKWINKKWMKLPKWLRFIIMPLLIFISAPFISILYFIAIIIVEIIKLYEEYK